MLARFARSGSQSNPPPLKSPTRASTVAIVKSNLRRLFSTARPYVSMLLRYMPLPCVYLCRYVLHRNG